MDLMTTLAAIPGAGPLLPYLAALIAVCAAIAVVLPHPATGATGVYPAIYAVVNFIAMNFGRAANADGGTVAKAPEAPAEPTAHS
jgi:hypothetical protein